MQIIDSSGAQDSTWKAADQTSQKCVKLCPLLRSRLGGPGDLTVKHTYLVPGILRSWTRSLVMFNSGFYQRYLIIGLKLVR